MGAVAILYNAMREQLQLAINQGVTDEEMRTSDSWSEATDAPNRRPHLGGPSPESPPHSRFHYALLYPYPSPNCTHHDPNVDCDPVIEGLEVVADIAHGDILGCSAV